MTDEVRVTDTIPKEAAVELGLCKTCNLFRKAGKNKPEQCVATLLPSLNWRGTPVGHCVFSAAERKERLSRG